MARNESTDARSDRPFVISRSFDGPRERLWKAWTERDGLMQ